MKHRPYKKSNGAIFSSLSHDATFFTVAQMFRYSIVVYLPVRSERMKGGRFIGTCVKGNGEVVYKFYTITVYYLL